MSKVAEQIEDFLGNGGRDLGFHEDNLPKIEDFQIIIQQMVKVWEYHGLTKEEYYGGKKNE